MFLQSHQGIQQLRNQPLLNDKIQREGKSEKKNKRNTKYKNPERIEMNGAAHVRYNAT